MDRWFITGLLWVYKDFVGTLAEELRQMRRENDDQYDGKLHFNKLPKNLGGEFGRKCRVAKRWLEYATYNLGRGFFFTLLAVDSHHASFQGRKKFARHYAYNRFTAMALTQGLSWHFSRSSEVRLKIYSDEKSRRPPGVLPAEAVDNFEEYIRTRVEMDAAKKPTRPKVECIGPVITVPSPKHRGPFSDELELLQFTDVLLGAFGICVECHVQDPLHTKVRLGRLAELTILDANKKPWEQELGFDPSSLRKHERKDWSREINHRRVSLCLFPDNKGQVYPLSRSVLPPDTSQLTLFDD